MKRAAKKEHEIKKLNQIIKEARKKRNINTTIVALKPDENYAASQIKKKKKKKRYDRRKERIVCRKIVSSIVSGLNDK